MRTTSHNSHPSPSFLLCGPVWAHALIRCASLCSRPGARTRSAALRREAQTVAVTCKYSASLHTCIIAVGGVASLQSPADVHSVTESCAAFACDSSKGFRYVADRHAIASDTDDLRVWVLCPRCGCPGRTTACDECEGLLLREDLRVLCGSLTASLCAARLAV